MRKLSDFHILGRTVDGSEPKLWVSDSKFNYLVKFQKNNWMNVFSEHISSTFINNTGLIKSHVTELIDSNKGTAVLCKDIAGKQELKSFDENTLRSSTDSSTNNYYFSDVLLYLTKIKGLDFNRAKYSFILMYLMDAILGNTDRHGSNWAILSNGSKSFSPIFDNGASLLPRSNYSVVGNAIEYFFERVFVFPNSKIIFDKKERSNYYKTINISKSIPEDILQRVQSVNINKCISFIDNVESLEPIQKKFLKDLITLRYECIIKDTYFPKVMENLNYEIKSIRDFITKLKEVLDLLPTYNKIDIETNSGLLFLYERGKEYNLL